MGDTKQRKKGSKMPDSEAKKRWDKENTTFIKAKLNRNTDKDILEYLADKPKQTVIKAALREYIQNHKND